ncbi:MAG: GAF domain-containing SpoIIE family protein phosphatase [bacterium]
MLSASADDYSTAERRLFDLENAVIDQQSRLDDIATMGLVITRLLDIDEVLSATMEMATRVVGGEVGCILLSEEGELRKRVSWGLDDSVLKQVSFEDHPSLVEWVFASGETGVLNQIPPAESARGALIEIIAAPLQSRDKHIGVVVVVNKIEGTGFSESDRILLETVVRFAAVAIDNANLLKQQLRQQQLEQELALAREVQQALLPPRSALFDGARVETVYRPAGQVGGDYFDVIKLSEKEFVVVVGDVSNHGVPAALQMAAVRSVFRMQMAKGQKCDMLMQEINDFLCEQVFKPDSSFITLVTAHFDLESMKCVYVNAGHLPPLQFGAAAARPREWRTGGTFLGQFPEFQYRCEEVSLTPGEKIFFYTDGISESESLQAEMFGRERVERVLQRHFESSGQVCLEALVREVDRFVGSHRPDFEQSDDITALVVEIV